MHTETATLLKKLSTPSEIQVVLSNSSKKIVDNFIEKNIPYAVFPISGDSMTCENTSISIPNKSKVLAMDLQLEIEKGLDNLWHKIPTNKPLLIFGETSSGKPFFLCKNIGKVDAIHNTINLVSNNPNYSDQLVHFSWVIKIFEIIEVL